MIVGDLGGRELAAEGLFGADNSPLMAAPEVQRAAGGHGRPAVGQGVVADVEVQAALRGDEHQVLAHYVVTNGDRQDREQAAERDRGRTGARPH